MFLKDVLTHLFKKEIHTRVLMYTHRHTHTHASTGASSKPGARDPVQISLMVAAALELGPSPVFSRKWVRRRAARLQPVPRHDMLRSKMPLHPLHHHTGPAPPKQEVLGI